MAEIIVNASTSAVLIDTSLLTTARPLAIVRLSSVQNPGQTVTIRDSVGYLSTPNAIVVSTTAGVLFADGTSSVRITQPFGYLSVRSRDATSWTLTNSFGFPQNLTVASVASLSTGTITTSTLTASSRISTNYLTANSIVTSSLTTAGPSQFSTLAVGPPYTLYPSTTASIYGSLYVSGPTTIGGSTTIGGDISAAAVTVGGTFSTLGSASVGSDFTVGGNILAPSSITTLSSLTATGTGTFSTLDISNSITAASAVITRSITCATVACSSLDISGGGIFFPNQSITTNGSILFFSTAFSTPAISTGSVSTSAFTTSNLTVGTSILGPTVQTMQLGAAKIINPAGSLVINSINASTLRASDISAVRLNVQDLYTSSLNFSGGLAIPSTGYFTVNTVLCSSFTTDAFYASTIAASNFAVESITVSSISLTGAFSGSTVTSVNIPNAQITAASLSTGSLQATGLTTSTLNLGDGGIQTASDLYITANSVSLQGVIASTVNTGALAASTMNMNNITLGAPVDPAIRGPYFIVTSSTNCVISGGPGDYYAPFFLSNVKPAGYTPNTPYTVQATFKYVIPNAGGYLPGNRIGLQNSLFWANELNTNSVVKYLQTSTTYTEAVHIYGYYAENQTSNISPIFQSSFNTVADWEWTATMINDSAATLVMQTESNANFSLVDPNVFINMQDGALIWNYALNATTIQNSFNDISTRNLLYYGSLNFVSDPRLKENVESADLRRCYETIRDIPLRRYAFKDVYLSTFQVSDRRRLGILADEYEVHFPKSVVEREANIPGYSTIKTVDTQQLEMAHLGATQYLLQEIAELRSTVRGIVPL